MCPRCRTGGESLSTPGQGRLPGGPEGSEALRCFYQNRSESRRRARKRRARVSPDLIEENGKIPSREETNAFLTFCGYICSRPMPGMGAGSPVPAARPGPTQGRSQARGSRGGTDRFCTCRQQRSSHGPPPHGLHPVGAWLPQPWRPRTLSQVWSRPPAERRGCGIHRRSGPSGFFRLVPCTSGPSGLVPAGALVPFIPDHTPRPDRPRCVSRSPAAGRLGRTRVSAAAVNIRVQIPVWTPGSPSLGKPQGARLLGRMVDSARNGSRAVCGGCALLLPSAVAGVLLRHPRGRLARAEPWNRGAVVTPRCRNS